MADDTDRTAQYLARSNDHFDEIRKDLERPVVNRQCRDPVFLAIFVVILCSYVGYGVYAIQIVYTQGLFNTNITTASVLALLTLDVIQVSLGYIVGMFGLALILAALVLIMLRYATLVAYYLMLAITFAALIALMVICFVYGQKSFGIVMAVLVGILFIIWLCYRKELLNIVVIMKTVTIFLSAKPMIFVMTLACITFCVATSIFWIAGYYSILTFYNQFAIGQAAFICLTIFWIFSGFYFLFFFFYGMVFLVGGEIAIWFYKSTEYSIAAPFKWLIRAHLGSISLGAFLIALIKTAQFIILMGRARNAKGIGAILAVVACMLRCILVRLEFWTRIINNYAVILMSLTGHGYLDSALTGGAIIFSNPVAFTSFSLISYFIRVAGTFTCAFIPTLVSYFLFDSLGVPNNLIAVGMGIVLFFSIMVSVVLLETFVEAMDSMFVFYCLEARMGQFAKRMDEIVDEQNNLEDIYAETFSGEFVRIQRQSRSDQTIQIEANGQRTVIEGGKIVSVHPVPLERAKNNAIPLEQGSSATIQEIPLSHNQPFNLNQQESFSQS